MFFACVGRTEDEANNKLKSIAEKLGIPPEKVLEIYASTVGTPDQVAAAVRRYIKAGFGLITFLGVLPEEEDIRLLSDEVIPQLRYNQICVQIFKELIRLLFTCLS